MEHTSKTEFENPQIEEMLREYAEHTKEKLHTCLKCKITYVTSPYYREEEYCIGCYAKTLRRTRVSKAFEHREAIIAMRKKGTMVKDISQHFGLSPRMAYKLIKRTCPELIGAYRRTDIPNQRSKSS